MQQGPPSPYLPDVLDLVPLDVVDSNVWQLLAAQPSSARSSLRQACRQTRRLADGLLTALALIDSYPPVTPAAGQTVASLTHERQEAWHQTAEQRATFLGRLPRLTSLALAHWPHETALSELLTRYGAATQGRVTKLTLSGGPLGTSAISSLPHACPRLTALHMFSAQCPSGDVLLPLTNIPTLTLLHMDLDVRKASGALALRSLGAMTHLRHVHLSAQGMRHEQLRPLSRLVSLRHLRIHADSTATSLLNISFLCTLTHLTHLTLHGVTHPVGAGAGADGGGAVAGGPGPAPPAAVSDATTLAVAALGNLRQLQHLCFSSAFVVGDTVFPGLRRLTRLTCLIVGCIQLSHPQPGRLPALQQLVLGTEAVLPSQLLHSLLPLLPLASLMGFGSHAPLTLVAGGQLGYNATAEATALRQAALHLSAAPCL